MDKSDALFIHRVINGMADSFISIFIPILIYKLTNDLSLSFVYLVAYTSTLTLSYAFLRKIMQKHSVLAIFLHSVFIITLQFILVADLNIYLILVIALLSGVEVSLYYGSLNLFFGTLEKKKNVSKFESGNYVGKIIVCILSAYVLGEVANSLIFVVIVSSALYLISLVPIIMYRKELKSNYENRKIVDEKVVFNYNGRMFLSTAFLNIFAAFRNAVLPLYLYVVGLSFTLIGVLVAFNYVIQIFAGYLTRYLNSKHLNRLNIILNCAILFACVVAILLIKNVVVIYIITIILGFSYQMLYVLMFSKFVRMQKDGYFYEALYQRDVCQNFATLCSHSTYFILMSFSMMFGVGMFACVGLLLSGYKIFKDEDYKQIEKAKAVKDNAAV